MGKRIFLALLTFFVLCLGMTAQTYADPVTGQLNLANPTNGGVSVNNKTIDFFNPVGPPNGTFNVGASSGTFAALSGTTGSILDLPSNLTGAVNLPGFLTFAANPALRFDLTYVYPGFVGVNGATPFVLQQVGPSVSVTAAFDGNFVSGADVTPYTGIFTTQIPNITVAQLQSAFNSGQTITSTYSASLTLAQRPIPEPATMLLLGTGLAGVGSVIRRRRNLKA